MRYDHSASVLLLHLHKYTFLSFCTHCNFLTTFFEIELPNFIKISNLPVLNKPPVQSLTHQLKPVSQPGNQIIVCSWFGNSLTRDNRSAWSQEVYHTNRKKSLCCSSSASIARSNTPPEVALVATKNKPIYFVKSIVMKQANVACNKLKSSRKTPVSYDKPYYNSFLHFQLP